MNRVIKVILLIVLLYVFFAFTHNMLYAAILAAVSSFSIFGIVGYLEKKDKELKAEPISIRIYRDADTIIQAYIPAKLVSKFKELYSDEAIISEDDYNKFILSNLKDWEAIEFFANLKRASDKVIQNVSFPLSDKHSGKNQTFFISYYIMNESNKLELNVINSIDNIPLTADDVISFTDFVMENKKRGERVLESDFQEWLFRQNQIKSSQ